MLEPYEGKLSRTVLRGERSSNTPDLPAHNFSGEESIHGAITMRGDKLNRYNTIFGGHNMRDWSIFASISALDSPDYLKTHSTFGLLIEGERFAVEIFACVGYWSGDMRAEKTDFDDDFAWWLKNIRVRSRVKTCVTRCLPRLVNVIPPETKWAVVMGCGYVLSANALNARLEAALLLHRLCPKIRFMLSGTEAGDYSEPSYMEKYLRQRGVPTEKIFLDGKGFNTAETFKNARRFGIVRALVVTNDFHLIRCVDTAWLYGLEAYGFVVPFEENTLHPYRWRYWLREKLAHYWSYGRFLVERWKNVHES